MNSDSAAEGSAGLQALYPDVDMADGLAEALKRMAVDLGFSLEGLVDGFGRAELATGRGTASIRLGAEERLFLVGIYESGIEWATGATADVGQALRAVAAWQEGEPLDGYVSRFPFMRPGELAYAFAEGNVAQAQWEILLGSDHPSESRQLLLRLAGFGELRSLFPEISYGSIRFTAPPPRRDDRVFFVRGDEELYRVQEFGAERREYALGDIGEVVRRLVEFLATG
ncbi:hypothetical protein ACEZCY_18280 [Streptacidiphilus sp. N1-12]|uniref:DUF3786 domain-containing protein n=2 Tax=Streptacidiphilus alkalitolerans TaxID=3342712 RepID=A0ABV6VC49_9ACTN